MSKTVVKYYMYFSTKSQCLFKIHPQQVSGNSSSPIEVDFGEKTQPLWECMFPYLLLQCVIDLGRKRSSIIYVLLSDVQNSIAKTLVRLHFDLK